MLTALHPSRSPAFSKDVLCFPIYADACNQCFTTSHVARQKDQGQKPLPDLPSLIIDYSRAKGCLPVVLNLDTVQPPDEEVNSSDDEDDDDDNLSFVDPDYQSMKDLR